METLVDDMATMTSGETGMGSGTDSEVLQYNSQWLCVFSVFFVC